VKKFLGKPNYSVAEHGFGGVQIEVLTDRPHQSLIKAASLVGIGRSQVLNLSLCEGGFAAGVEARLHQAAQRGVASIVSISFGEVNTVRRFQIHKEAG